jgi:hypothetical protein
MMARCYQPCVTRFSHYGGRGIMVCERWRFFENFLADMGEAPLNMSLDRIDVNGNYEPNNCRWATVTQQARNTRANHYLTVHDETHCLAEWAEITGINYGTLCDRVRRGWDADRAIGAQA